MSEEVIAKGFDREMSFDQMKDQLSTIYNKELDTLADKIGKNKNVKISLHRLIYIVIACIQLRNGSRISEAIEALQKFLLKGIKSKVIVKIAKSESIKYKKDTKEQYTTKRRNREILFPTSWIGEKCIDYMKEYQEISQKCLDNPQLKISVCNFLQRNFNCNTHSLRYAFINYMISVEKIDLPVLAKFIGHSNIMQLVTYTQNLRVNKIFEMEI